MKATENKKGAADCQSVYCFSKATLPTLTVIPASFDQRERGLTTMAKDQAQCGCCFAFSAVAILENSMLLELDYWKTSHNYEFSAKANLNLSEYYLGYNGKGFSKWCDGGSTSSLLQYYFDFQGKTNLVINNKIVLQIQNASAFPYNATGMENIPYSANQFLEPLTNNEWLPLSDVP